MCSSYGLLRFAALLPGGRDQVKKSFAKRRSTRSSVAAPDAPESLFLLLEKHLLLVCIDALSLFCLLTLDKVLEH